MTRPISDWTARIADGRRRVAQLQADLAAGVDEAEAAHRSGFDTRRDLDELVTHSAEAADMKLQSVTEAAATLGLSRQRVLQLIAAGQLKADRVGSTYALRPQDVAKFAATERPGGRPPKDRS